MTYATKSRGSIGYGKSTVKGAAGNNNEGMRQTFKQTGEIAGLKASGVPNNSGRAPVPAAPWGGDGGSVI